MSRTMEQAPTMAPSRSRIGQRVTSTSSRCPVLVTRSVSKCSTRSPRPSRSSRVAISSFRCAGASMDTCRPMASSAA